MKKLEEMKLGQKVYVYQLITFPDREVFKKCEATININSTIVTRYLVAVGKEIGRYQLRSDEGIVYRNALWLSEENDDYAKRAFRAAYEEKLKVFRSSIDLYEKRIDLINVFFGEYE